MKIVYVITQGTWGGAQSHVYSLLKDQTLKKNEIWLITGNRGRLTEQVTNYLPNVKLIILKSIRRDILPVDDLKAVFQLRKIIKSIRPDIVHLHSSKAGTVGRLAAFHIVPVIYTVHGWAFTPGTSKKRAMVAVIVERLLQSATTKYICVSKFDYDIGRQKQLMNAKHPGIVIHNGVLAEKINNKKKNNEKFVISMAARFENPKRQDLLIKSIAAVPHRDNIKLILLGDGPLIEACKKLVEDLNIQNLVKFKGSVSDVQAYYEVSDVVVLISDHEGLPISLVEGLATGRPIIASDVGGNRELIEGNGYLVSNSIKSIAKAINNLKNDKNIRQKMSLKSKKMFNEEFTNDEMLKKTNHVYSSVIRNED